jgi:preprotein translocase subunit SecG
MTIILLVLFSAAAIALVVRSERKKPFDQMTDDEQFLELDERI